MEKLIREYFLAGIAVGVTITLILVSVLFEFFM